MKKILLTGSNGFIGKNITESFLGEKYQLITPTRLELDLSNQNSVDDYFKSNTFDIVIHGAVKPGHRNAVDNVNTLNINTRMFYNLVRHSEEYGKFINLGSGAIYDNRYYQPKMNEWYAGQHIPVDDHGLCKYMVEREIRHLDNFVDLRIFGVFGKYEDYAIRFISNAICKNLFGLPITIKQDRKFDYLWINDLMPILEYFIENNIASKAYNITPDYSIKLSVLANMINTISEKSVPVLIGLEGYGVEYSGDNSLLKSYMPALQLTLIEESVQQLYEWYLLQKKMNKLDLNKLLLDK